MLRTDPNMRFSAQRACLAMRQAISNMSPELLQIQINKPFSPPERREELVAALNEFAQDFDQVDDNNQEVMMPIKPSVVARGDVDV